MSIKITSGTNSASINIVIPARPINPTLFGILQTGPWRSVSRTFTGLNLGNATSVLINGQASTIISNDDTSITVDTPVFSSNGVYNVIVTTPLGNSGISGVGLYLVVDELRFDDNPPWNFDDAGCYFQ